jgi:hypothetical protein
MNDVKGTAPLLQSGLPFAAGPDIVALMPVLSPGEMA